MKHSRSPHSNLWIDVICFPQTEHHKTDWVGEKVALCWWWSWSGSFFRLLGLTRISKIRQQNWGNLEDASPNLTFTIVRIFGTADKFPFLLKKEKEKKKKPQAQSFSMMKTTCQNVSILSFPSNTVACKMVNLLQMDTIASQKITKQYMWKLIEVMGKNGLSLIDQLVINF